MNDKPTLKLPRKTSGAHQAAVLSEKIGDFDMRLIFFSLSVHFYSMLCKSFTENGINNMFRMHESKRY